jgi:hypothetical protein
MGSFATGTFWQTDLAQEFSFDPFLEDVPPLVGARDFYTFAFSSIPKDRDLFELWRTSLQPFPV